VMASCALRALVRPFAQRLLEVDLPGLDRTRREQTVAFAVGRVEAMPAVLRIGVFGIAAPLRLVALAPGGGRLIAWLVDHPIPLAGEYVRMLRSLSYAYVWERWPATAVDGSGR
jgi:hypothetical protein